MPPSSRFPSSAYRPRAPEGESGGRAGLDMLDRIGSAMRIERERAIFLEGDPADHYYKVLSGTVRLYSMLADGRRQIVQFVFPSQFFGLSAAKDYAMSAEAVSDVSLIRYPRRHVDNLFASEHSIARVALDLANDELRAAQRQMILLGRRTARERLVVFLLDMADQAKPGEADGAFFHLPMTRRDIADYLGLTIETVSRVFGQLKRARLIELKGSHDVALLKPQALSELIE
jgi:CRP/FNR family transcriptional regulator